MFAPSTNAPLHKVNAAGGRGARRSTTLAAGETGHHSPWFLPDGRKHALPRRTPGIGLQSTLQCLSGCGRCDTCRPDSSVRRGLRLRASPVRARGRAHGTTVRRRQPANDRRSFHGQRRRLRSLPPAAWRSAPRLRASSPMRAAPRSRPHASPGPIAPARRLESSANPARHSNVNLSLGRSTAGRIAHHRITAQPRHLGD